MEIITLIIVLIALTVGAYTDIKTREVPDWINKGLIATGIGLSLLFSVIYSNWNYFFGSLIGFVAFFILALVMYYSGQWGGGDSKMIMGLGAMIGIDIMGFNLRESFLLGFLFNMLIIGAIYGLLWSFVLSIKNQKKLVKEIKRLIKKRIGTGRFISFNILFLILTVLILLNWGYSTFIIFSLLLFLIVLLYIWIYVKAVENACMLKYVTPDRLTEGDWIAKNVKVNNKIIVGPKDLGIEKKQIRLLIKLYKQKKIKQVLVKEGIPFVPSFLIAFIVSYVWGNLLWLFV